MATVTHERAMDLVSAPDGGDRADEAATTTTTTTTMGVMKMDSASERASGDADAGAGAGTAGRGKKSGSGTKRKRKTAKMMDDSSSLFWLVEAAEKASPDHDLGGSGNGGVKTKPPPKPKRPRGRPRKYPPAEPPNVARAKKSVVESPTTTTTNAGARVVPAKKKKSTGIVAKAKSEKNDGEDDALDASDDASDDDASADADGVRSKNGGSSSLTQQWSRDEDALLMRLISQHGAKRWSYVATQMQGRRGKQCRDRYLNHLRPGIKTGLWTPEEEVVLIEGHKLLGTKWAALAKLLEGRPENAIKNHWHATWRCKWTKIQGEGKLTPLQKYQLALRGETPEHLASQARASAKKRREEKKIAKTASETEAAKEEVVVEFPKTEVTTATEVTTETQATATEAEAPVDAQDDGGARAENVDESFAARSGMSRSAQNSRYSRAEREEIDVSLKKMRERMSKELETITAVDPGAVASTQPADSNAATTTDVKQTPTETETKTPKTPKTKKTKKTAAATGEPNPTQLARASVSSKSQDFIDVGEHPIGIAQCQAAVMSTGAAESTMLTSVAQRAGPVYLREYCELSPYCIRKGVEAITLVMRTKWPLSRIAVAIRTGSLEKGDLKLCIAVSGEKWDDVIAAAEFASSQIKTKFLFRELKLSLIASGQETV